MSVKAISITTDIENYYFYNNEQINESPRSIRSTISPTSNIINDLVFCSSNHDTAQTADATPCNVECIDNRKSIHNLKSLTVESNLFVNTNWKYINKIEPSETTLTETITLELFIQECERSLKNHQLPFIPVIIGDNVEYIKIIQIRSNYIGVGIKCNHLNEELFDERLPLEICRLIVDFCIHLEVTMIYLDFDYILDHHQLLPQHKQYKNLMNIATFKPLFLSKLIIQYEDEDSDIELEEGEPLSVPSDWEDDDDKIISIS